MEESLGLGKKSYGTDTETWSWFWLPIPKPGFGRTLSRRLSQIFVAFLENLNFMLLPCCLTHLQKKQLVSLMTKIILIISCLRNNLQPL